MKVAIVLLGLLVCAMAVPVQKRMVYLQPNGMYRAAPMTQRLMYVQYVQPARPNARSNGVATFVAGDSVATGSIVKDTYEEEEVAVAPLADDEEDTKAGSIAQSVAEAYPAPPAENDDDEVTADVAPLEKKPKELAIPAEDFPVAEDEAKIAIEAEEENQNDEPQEDEAPLYIPVKKVGPPKRVYVELDDNTPPARVPVYQAPAAQNRPTQRPTQKPTKKPQGPSPSGSFFPINFGGTNGGAIAIANSFSTGDGGSATSHAIAYGSQDAARARKTQEIRRRH